MGQRDLVLKGKRSTETGCVVTFDLLRRMKREPSGRKSRSDQSRVSNALKEVGEGGRISFRRNEPQNARRDAVHVTSLLSSDQVEAEI